MVGKKTASEPVKYFQGFYGFCDVCALRYQNNFRSTFAFFQLEADQVSSEPNVAL